jgi:hypothetical protein
MALTRTARRATVWKVTVGVATFGLATFGLAACGTSSPPPAAGGPPLAVANQQASAMVAAVCGTACPSLPAVAVGYEPLAAFGPSSASAEVDFDNRPLEVCFAVGDLSVDNLTYEIGSPIGGSTTLFDDVNQDVTALQGCLPDPGNDSGSNTVRIVASGPGSWVVRIDEQE